MKDTPGSIMDERDANKDEQDGGGATRSSQDPSSGFALPSAIGDRLKAYYNDVASEPVPDRFLSLLDQLDQAEARGKGRADRNDADD